MDHLVVCKQCNESEELEGFTENNQISVRCLNCGLTWVRDLTPKCKICDSSNVRPAFEAIVSKSRGTQLSVQSSKLIYLCVDCDASRLKDYQKRNSPLMPKNLPTT
ncbi:MAG: hypothetical protein CL455_05905 [Acidimicrobiaceae bacterium]|nr:hypothetical protein [Acidimicrobiaceae bacterium]